MSSSKSTGVSRYWAGINPPDGPPVWTPLSFLLPGIPPPILYIMSARVIPMGTSTKPVLLTLPTSEKILVPLLLSVPMELNQRAPRLMIRGTFAKVSTLLRMLGRFQTPLSDVWTYFGLGSPTLPSRAFIKAVDSPETKAPAPLCMDTSKSKPVPSMSLPSKPFSRACCRANFALSTARGYSMRT